MAHLLSLKTFAETRGKLTVIEKLLPFEVKRIFYIYDVDDSVRGKHRHHKTIQAAICIKGSCIVVNNDGKAQQTFVLDSPEKCLILEPSDWHKMEKFSKDSVLLVLASEEFDPADYIFEEYPS
jgi:dTDP-4-dehydrorhamnose 3,5-epimerase-like enzyme